MGIVRGACCVVHVAFVWYVWCAMRDAIGGPWCAVRSVWCVVCGAWDVGCGMRDVLCGECVRLCACLCEVV